MAMLQFGGVLSSGTVRTTPRGSWWITAQHLLHASSVATNIANPATNTTKEEKIENVVDKQQGTSMNKLERRKFISSVFKRLLDDSEKSVKNVKENPKESNSQRTLTSSNQLLDKINSATNVNELLSATEHPDFNRRNASSVMYLLSHWTISGKVKMSDIENDERYQKICSILNYNKGSSKQSLLSMISNVDKFSSLEGILQTEKAKQQIANLNINESVSLLKMFASKQKRPTPLLHSLAKKLTNTNENLNIKELGDILYSMAVLNFYDEALTQKVVTELHKVVHNSENNAVIRSILTSISLLRFKNEELLDELSTWIVKHQERIRPQEITSLLLTLANLGYTPKHFDIVLEQIVKRLKESDMCQSKEWLDIIWSLCVLNHATSEQYESVLNSDFVSRVIDSSDLRLQISKILKLLNINAAAQLLMPDYKGPLLPEDSELFKVPVIRSDKMSLSNSVISALKMLLPSDSMYFNINVDTQMGFSLDAEFCVDKKGTPVAINLNSDSDKQIFRIGLLTCGYTEFCRGVNEVIGPIKLYQKLLEQKGYKVLIIPYTDVDLKDKIVTRVKYINEKIKLILESSTTK